MCFSRASPFGSPNKNPDEVLSKGWTLCWCLVYTSVLLMISPSFYVIWELKCWIFVECFCEVDFRLFNSRLLSIFFFYTLIRDILSLGRSHYFHLTQTGCGPPKICGLFKGVRGRIPLLDNRLLRISHFREGKLFPVEKHFFKFGMKKCQQNKKTSFAVEYCWQRRNVDSQMK